MKESSRFARRGDPFHIKPLELACDAEVRRYPASPRALEKRPEAPRLGVVALVLRCIQLALQREVLLVELLGPGLMAVLDSRLT